MNNGKIQFRSDLFHLIFSCRFFYVAHFLINVYHPSSRERDWLTYEKVSVRMQTFLLIYPFLEVLLSDDKIEVLIYNIDYFADGIFISNNFVDYL